MTDAFADYSTGKVPTYSSGVAALRRDAPYHGLPCRECGEPVEATETIESRDARIYVYECTGCGMPQDDWDMEAPVRPGDGPPGWVDPPEAPELERNPGRWLCRERDEPLAREIVRHYETIDRLRSGEVSTDRDRSIYFDLDLVTFAGFSLRVYEDDRVLLLACLRLREVYPELEGWKPPYAALVAVAREVGLPMDDEDDSILGRSTYSVARRIFEDLSPGDVKQR